MYFYYQLFLSLSISESIFYYCVFKIYICLQLFFSPTLKEVKYNKVIS